MNCDLVELISADGNSTVKIDGGELVSYTTKLEVELIHQGRNRDDGWGRSDAELFPIIGPTKRNNYVVKTPRGECFLDQHGLARELPYLMGPQEFNNSIEFTKMYESGAQVKNSRFPENSELEFVSWPYDFRIDKKFTLSNKDLAIDFKLIADKNMPFMFGYHPAFALVPSGDQIIRHKTGTVGIDNVIKRGSSAYSLIGVNEVDLIRGGFSDNLNLKSFGFGNMMLWSPVRNMVCIEPITHYPDLKSQNYFGSDHKKLIGVNQFSLIITPFNSELY